MTIVRTDTVPPPFDFPSVYILVGLVGVTLLYLSLVVFRSIRHSSDTLLAGATRWAAAAGDVETLNKLSLSPDFDVEAPLAGFTALAAASVAGHRGESSSRLSTLATPFHPLKTYFS